MSATNEIIMQTALSEKREYFFRLINCEQMLSTLRRDLVEEELLLKEQLENEQDE